MGLEGGGGLTGLGTNLSPEGTASSIEGQSAFLSLEGVEKAQYQPATIIPFAQFNEISATDPNSAVGEGGQDWLTGGTETVPLVGTVQFFGSASDSGSGYGDQGSIDGDDAFGWGSSSGSGYGSSGNPEAQFGSGYGSGYGSSGSNPGTGYGTGYGSGYGSSGSGYGSPNSGSGYSAGYGSGSGYGTGYGSNSGTGYGTGYGSGYGSGSGGSDNGSGSDGQPPIEPLPFLKTSGDAPAPIITWNQQTSSKPKEFLDSKGNAYIARLDYNGAGQSYTLSKYDKSGNQLWLRTTDTSSVNWYEEAYWQKGTSFALDSDDNLYAFGQASLFAADFQSTSASKYALVKYDSNGNPIWHQAMDADGYPFFRLVINQERIYVAGTSAKRYYGSFRYKTFLAAYDVAGNQLGKQQFDSYTLRHVDSLRGVIEYYGWSVGDSVSADVRFSNLTFDEQSNAYVIASTDPTVEPGSVAGDTEVLIAKIDSNGNLIWKQQFGIITPNPDPQFAIYPIPHSDFPHDISVDRQGNIYIGGTSYGGGYSITNPGGVTGFIAKFDGEGNQQWLQQLGSRDSGLYYGQGRYKMSFDGYNELLIVGDADTLVGRNQYGSLMYEDRILVAKYDTEGNQLWTYNLKGTDVTEFSPDQKQGYLISGYDYPNGWTLTIPDRLSLVLEQAKSLVSAADASAIEQQGSLLSEIGSKLLKSKGTTKEAVYNALDDLWGGLLSKLGEIHTTASDIQETAQEFKNFLNTSEKSLEKLLFFTKLLYSAAEIPELADDLQNTEFTTALVSLGKAYADLEPISIPKETSPKFFLDTLWNAKDTTDLVRGKEEIATFLKESKDTVKLLEFDDRLLRAVGQLPQELQQEKRDPKFLSAIVRLGGAYAALEPVKAISSGHPLNFFLDTLLQAEDSITIQKGAREIAAFTQKIENPTKLIEYHQKLLDALILVPSKKEKIRNPSSIEELFLGSKLHTAIRSSGVEIHDLSNFLHEVWVAKNQEELEVAAQNYENFIEISNRNKQADSQKC